MDNEYGKASFALECLNEWLLGGGKERSVHIFHDDSFGSSMWEVELTNTRMKIPTGWYSTKRGATVYAFSSSGEDPEPTVVFCGDFSDLEDIILAAVDLAIKLEL